MASQYFGVSASNVVDLSSQTLSTLPTNVLTPTTTALTLSDNEIRRLSLGTLLAAAPTLAALAIDANGLSRLTGDANSVTQRSVLEYLDVRDNCLDDLPGDAAALFTSLCIARLASNSLRAIPTGALARARCLHTLDLSANCIGKSSSSSLAKQLAALFAAAPRLAELRLDDNGISSLPVKPFAAAGSLDLLSLKANELTHLPDAIVAAPRLTQLLLHNNKLTAISPIILDRIQVVALSGNPLHTTPSSSAQQRSPAKGGMPWTAVRGYDATAATERTGATAKDPLARQRGNGDRKDDDGPSSAAGHARAAAATAAMPLFVANAPANVTSRSPSREGQSRSRDRSRDRSRQLTDRDQPRESPRRHHHQHHQPQRDPASATSDFALPSLSPPPRGRSPPAATIAGRRFRGRAPGAADRAGTIRVGKGADVTGATTEARGRSPPKGAPKARLSRSGSIASMLQSLDLSRSSNVRARRGDALLSPRPEEEFALPTTPGRSGGRSASSTPRGHHALARTPARESAAALFGPDSDRPLSARTHREAHRFASESAIDRHWRDEAVEQRTPRGGRGRTRDKDDVDGPDGRDGHRSRSRSRSQSRHRPSHRTTRLAIAEVILGATKRSARRGQSSNLEQYRAELGARTPSPPPPQPGRASRSVSPPPARQARSPSPRPPSATRDLATRSQSMATLAPSGASARRRSDRTAGRRTRSSFRLTVEEEEAVDSTAARAASDEPLALVASPRFDDRHRGDRPPDGSTVGRSLARQVTEMQLPAVAKALSLAMSALSTCDAALYQAKQAAGTADVPVSPSFYSYLEETRDPLMDQLRLAEPDVGEEDSHVPSLAAASSLTALISLLTHVSGGCDPHLRSTALIGLQAIAKPERFARKLARRYESAAPSAGEDTARRRRRHAAIASDEDGDDSEGAAGTLGEAAFDVGIGGGSTVHVAPRDADGAKAGRNPDVVASPDGHAVIRAGVLRLVAEWILVAPEDIAVDRRVRRSLLQLTDMAVAYERATPSKLLAGAADAVAAAIRPTASIAAALGSRTNGLAATGGVGLVVPAVPTTSGAPLPLPLLRATPEYESIAASSTSRDVLPVIALHPQEMARQLASINWYLLSSVLPSEWLTWVLGDTAEQSAAARADCHGLRAVLRYFDRVSRWVSAEILLPAEPALRAVIYKGFISMANAALDLHDYMGFAAIMTGLQRPSVTRLSTTHSLLGSTTRRTLTALLDLQNEEAAVQWGRRRATRPPANPHPGVILARLRAAGASVLPSASANIVMRRLGRITEVAAAVARWRAVPFDLRRLPGVQRSIAPDEPMSDRQLDELSTQRETTRMTSKRR